MKNIDPIFGIVMGLFIILCSIGIIVAFIFQKKQEKKAKKYKKIIEEKGNIPLAYKDGLNKEDIISIDSDVDINKLMPELYEKYIAFQNKVNSKDLDLDDLVTNNLKDRYSNIFKSNINTIIEKIDLIGYSITKFEKEYLEFRVNINCTKYKVSNEEIIYGSNIEKIELINVLTFKKKNDIWLLDNINEVFEKKLSK